jgi:hypothetical protein
MYAVLAELSMNVMHGQPTETGKGIRMRVSLSGFCGLGGQREGKVGTLRQKATKTEDNAQRKVGH